MSNPDIIVTETTSKVIWELWPSSTSKSLFLGSIPGPLFKQLIKWEIQLSNNHLVIHAFGYMAITALSS
jgi:hypothetical protein